MNGFLGSSNHGWGMAHGVDHLRIRGPRSRSTPKPEPLKPLNERFGNQRRAMADSSGTSRGILLNRVLLGYPKTPNREEEPVLGFAISRSGQCPTSHNSRVFQDLRSSFRESTHKFWRRAIFLTVLRSADRREKERKERKGVRNRF